MENVHISRIRIGDTVLHDGEVKTVSGKSLKYDSFMGITLFGDCYRLGYKLVTRILL
jgi:hypothetical protein